MFQLNAEPLLQFLLAQAGRILLGFHLAFQLGNPGILNLQFFLRFLLLLQKGDFPLVVALLQIPSQLGKLVIFLFQFILEFQLLALGYAIELLPELGDFGFFLAHLAFLGVQALFQNLLRFQYRGFLPCLELILLFSHPPLDFLLKFIIPHLTENRSIIRLVHTENAAAFGTLYFVHRCILLFRFRPEIL